MCRHVAGTYGETDQPRHSPIQKQTGSSGKVRKRSHSTSRRRLTITHTQVRVRLAQPAKQYAATTNIRTTSTQIVTESNTCRPILLAIDVSRSAHTGFKTSCNEHLDPQINCRHSRLAMRQSRVDDHPLIAVDHGGLPADPAIRLPITPPVNRRSPVV